MAAAIQVAGLATIQLDTGSSHALQTFGYTRNGAETRSNGFFLDVPTDENGGDDGPPTDIQQLGETQNVRLEMTKWDETVAGLVRSRSYGGTDGTVPTVGQLLIGGGLTFRLCINTTTTPRNYPIVIFREPIELSKGTKFSTLVVEAVAYKNGSNVLYNVSTS